MVMLMIVIVIVTVIVIVSVSVSMVMTFFAMAMVASARAVSVFVQFSITVKDFHLNKVEGERNARHPEHSKAIRLGMVKKTFGRFD